MDPLPTPYEMIERYLLNQLSDAEKTAMERAIAEQPELARELELRRLEFDTSQELIAQDIGALFKKLRDEEQAPPAAGRGGNRRLWYYLAAAAVALLLVFWAYQNRPERNHKGEIVRGAQIPDSTSHSQDSLQQLTSVQLVDTSVSGGGAIVNKKQTPLPQANAPKSNRKAFNTRLQALANQMYAGASANWSSQIRGNASPGAQQELNQAIDAYQKKAFDTMLEHLKPIQPGHPRYYTAQLLRAHAYFNQNKFKEAATAARSVIDSNIGGAYREEAQWLLVLALVADGKVGMGEYEKTSNAILADSGSLFFPQMTALRDCLPERLRQR